MYLYIPNIILKGKSREQNQTSYASIIRGKSYFKVHFIALGIAASLLWNLKHIFNVDTIHSKDMVTFPHALISTSGGRIFNEFQQILKCQIQILF